jgi:H+/gluconate symporter-like permease
MPLKKLAAVLALSAALGSATASGATAASLSRRDLLALAFPAWQAALDKTGKPAAP